MVGNPFIMYVEYNTGFNKRIEYKIYSNRMTVLSVKIRCSKNNNSLS